MCNSSITIFQVSVIDGPQIVTFGVKGLSLPIINSSGVYQVIFKTVLVMYSRLMQQALLHDLPNFLIYVSHRCNNNI